MSLEADKATEEAFPTEIFLPAYHFDQSTLHIEVSGGRWTVDSQEVGDGKIQMLKWWHGVGEQNIVVRGTVRTHSTSGGAEDDFGYLEQYKRSFCAVM